jgi:hypothetical protein
MTMVRLLIALAALLTVVPASAAKPRSDVTGNWGGYVVVPVPDPTTGETGTFSTVSGTWIQPAASCGSRPVGTATSAAFWVGLGGNSQSSNALEQIGTEVDCTALGTPRYSAWYELVPALSRPVGLTVSPGDRLTASVTVAGSRVTVTMRNLTRGTRFSRVLRAAAADTTSAEWIAEAPSSCSSASNCRATPLTDFGTVAFTSASVTDGAGHAGTISDPAWSATALTLESGSGGFGYSRYRAETTPDRATPGSLGPHGAGFTIAWSSERPASGTGEPGHGSGGSGYRD